MQTQVSLIPFSQKHIESTYAWVNDPNLRSRFLMRGEVTPNGHSEYFKRTMADSTQRVFAILANGRHVGNCGLKHICLHHRRAELWIYIGEETVRNKGIGKSATKLLVEEARTSLALKTLCLHFADFNKAARQLYQGLGFTKIATDDPRGEWSGRDYSVVRMERSLSARDVAMMQPTFLPWQGFFELIRMSDVFILLDDFQFSVQSYHQRNRLFVNRNQPDWITAPVMKTVSFAAPLTKTKLNEAAHWRKKIWKRIVQNYRKAPYFPSLAPVIEQWLMKPAPSLAEQNVAFIRLVCELLSITPEFRLSSEFKSTQQSSLRVQELLRAVDAERYFSAKGSFPYMHAEGVFPLNDITVLFQDFQCSPYSQVGSSTSFVPSLSVLDALLNVGPEKTLELIKGGTHRWATWDDMTARAIKSSGETIKEDTHDH